MSASDWRQTAGDGSGGSGPKASARSTWAKVIIMIAIIGALGWVLVLQAQYCETGKPLTQLPAVPAQVASVFSAPPTYEQSIYGVARPLGVAVNAQGSVYITESAGDRMIRVFDDSGVEITSFAPTGSSVPGRIPVYVAVSPQGEVYVSDREARAIFIFSEDGTLQRTLAPPAQVEGWDPLGVSVDDAGNVYVTDVTPGKHRVIVLDAEGNLKMQFGTEGSEVGEFWFPNDVAVDDEGRIYVADSNNGRVQVFDSTGQFLYLIGRGLARGDLSLPRGLAVDDKDHLFVVDTSRQSVQVYDVSGSPKFLHSLGQDEGSGFSFPNGLALGEDGILYVTDRENDRVQVWRYP